MGGRDLHPANILLPRSLRDNPRRLGAPSSALTFAHPERALNRAAPAITRHHVEKGKRGSRERSPCAFMKLVYSLVSLGEEVRLASRPTDTATSPCYLCQVFWTDKRRPIVDTDSVPRVQRGRIDHLSVVDEDRMTVPYGRYQLARSIADANLFFSSDDCSQFSTEFARARHPSPSRRVEPEDDNESDDYLSRFFHSGYLQSRPRKSRSALATTSKVAPVSARIASHRLA